MYGYLWIQSLTTELTYIWYLANCTNVFEVYVISSLAPVRSSYYYELVTFKVISRTDIWNISCGIASQVKATTTHWWLHYISLCNGSVPWAKMTTVDNKMCKLPKKIIQFNFQFLSGLYWQLVIFSKSLVPDRDQAISNLNDVHYIWYLSRVINRDKKH